MSEIQNSSVNAFDRDKYASEESIYKPDSEKFTKMLKILLETPIKERKNTHFNQLLKKFIGNVDSLPIGLTCKNDIEVYNYLYNYCHLCNAHDRMPTSSIGNESEHRASNRANEIQTMLKMFKISTKDLNYLDYGCSNGTLTSAIGEHLEMNTYGCDVPKWHGIDNKCNAANVKYHHLSDDGSMPSNLSMKFNLITAFMVLHHLSQNKLNKIVSELVDRIIDGGYFILREHDAINQETIDYCHFEHALYDLVIPDKPFTQFYDEYIGNYHSMDYWENMLCGMGLDLIYTTKAWGATRYVYMLFMKPQKIDTYIAPHEHITINKS
jgi:phospholipid N-methyltransferase